MGSNNTSSSKPFSIAIVGGGISGLCLAITLLQHDIPLTIYEAASNFAEIGAGIAFGPNASRAMEMMSPKVYDAFKKCRTTNTWTSNNLTTVRVGDIRRADKDGVVRKSDGLKVGDVWFARGYYGKGEAGGVYRAHFLDELVKSIPDGMTKFRKRLVDLRNAEDGSEDMVLHFADGTTAQHSVVFGCDGIKSMTRKWLLGKDDPAATAVFTGKYAYRGVMPMDEAIKIIGETATQSAQVYFGYGGHFLTYPIAKGKMFNVVAFQSCQAWDHEEWVIPATKERIETDWAGWGATTRNLMHALQNPTIWALFEHLPCSTYTRGRVCLVGDAAHASTPHQGSGGAMAIEDCLIIGALMQDVTTVDDLERVFSTFDQVRMERTQKLVVTSKEAGMLYDFELIGDDLDKIEENFQHRMGWIWDFDLEEHVKEAKRIFKEKRELKL